MSENAGGSPGYEVASPEDRLANGFNNLRVYIDASDRLSTIDPEFKYGILDDIPRDAMREVEEHTGYMQMVANYYLGDDPEAALADMGFWGFMRLAHKMREEVNLPALTGDAVKFTNIVGRHFQVSHSRTVGRGKKKVEDPLEEVEAAAAEQAFTIADTSQPFDHTENPRAVLKAVKVLKGLTKETLPGDVDFAVLRELICYGGAIVLSRAGPYLPLARRVQLAQDLFKSLQDPRKVQDIFAQGEWYLYLRSQRAPKTLEELTRKHQVAFQDIEKAEERTAILPRRVQNVTDLLRQIADSGITRSMETTLTALDKLSKQDGFVGSSIAEVLPPTLFKMVDKVSDADQKEDFKQRIAALLTAA